MIKLDFSKKEVEYFKENCYFTDEEEKILDLRLKGYSIVEIHMTLAMSERTVSRRIKNIKRKILRAIERM